MEPRKNNSGQPKIRWEGFNLDAGRYEDQMAAEEAEQERVVAATVQPGVGGRAWLASLGVRGA